MILYDPSKVLNKIASKKKIKNLVTKRASLKKSALNFVNEIDFLSKKSVERLALKTIKEYKRRSEGAPEIKIELAKDPKQLINRIQNLVILELSKEIKTKYKGKRYKWLPSDADEPDPEHQLKYGKVYTIGKGEMPGERYGCKCGMQILVDESSLDI